MAEIVKVEIEGLKELDERLGHLVNKAKGQAMRKALRAGGKVILKSARSNLKSTAPKEPKNLFAKVRVRASQGIADVAVGAKKGTRLPKLAHLIEFGTAPHVIKVKSKKALSDKAVIYGTEVQHPGTGARPFLRPALDNNVGAATEAFRAKLAEAILAVEQADKPVEVEEDVNE